MLEVLASSLYWFTRLLELLIFVRVVLSWLPVDSGRGLPGMIYSLTEPMLGPIRAMFRRSPIGGLMIDFSPIIALLLIDVVYRVLLSIIYQIF